MGLFNRLYAILQCPRCGHVGESEIEFKFGYMQLFDYRLGDVLEWDSGFCLFKDHIDEGYAECAGCLKDFWVTIYVKQDVIIDVQVDPDRPGYIP